MLNCVSNINIFLFLSHLILFTNAEKSVYITFHNTFETGIRKCLHFYGIIHVHLLKVLPHAVICITLSATNPNISQNELFNGEFILFSFCFISLLNFYLFVITVVHFQKILLKLSDMIIMLLWSLMKSCLP